jgi:2-polyprenyl-3-methyl-5-hydroxy-6-metoxy-1,4-benzoquinol methylase
MNSPFHQQSCGSCGSETIVHLFSANDRNQRATQHSFSISRCTHCGVVQTVPQPSGPELAHLYPEHYYLTAIDQRTLYAAQHDKIVLVRAHKSAGRLLDVGAGVGLFVRHARDEGYDAQGIEVSSQAVSIGTKALDIPLLCGEFDSVMLPDAPFDIVTFWHVFEHLPRPKETLQKVHRILRPGGILIIAVPNFGSIQSRVFRGRWYHLDIPRHLFHFSPETLRNLVEGSGFHVTETRYRWREHDPAGFIGSVMRLSPPQESLPHKVIRKVLGMPTARLCAAVESSVHKGGTFALVADRK